MKPGTKRWLAKEWLILMVIMGTIASFWASFRYSEASDEFWRATETGKRVCEDATLPISEFTPREKPRMTLELSRSRDSGDAGRISAAYNRLEEQSEAWDSYVATLPFIIRIQAFSYAIAGSLFAAVENHLTEFALKSLSIYLVLWIPRLTVRSIRTLVSKPESGGSATAATKGDA